ncbi:hypothetical protein ACWPM1_11145 [Tsuneonella sp. HG249]
MDRLLLGRSTSLADVRESSELYDPRWQSYSAKENKPVLTMAKGDEKTRLVIPLIQFREEIEHLTLFLGYRAFLYRKDDVPQIKA